MNKRTSAPWAIALAAAVGGVLFASPAGAQEADGPAPSTPGEPVNPRPAPATVPAPTAPAAPTAPEPSEPAKDSDATPGMEPTKPSPALLFLQSRREAAAAREGHGDREVELPDDGKLRHHQDHWIGLLGVRVGRVTSPGLDPFARSDEVAQVSLGLGGTVLTAGNFSLAGLFLYDVGGRSDTARGADSDLSIHRLTLGAEGRYHFIRQLFVFGRAAPGALHSIAQIEDDWGVENRAARNWVFAMDLSAGAMFELAGWVKSRKRLVSGWIGFEGGYGFAGESELTMTPDEAGNGPERGVPLDLGPLALSGPFLRTSLVITY